MSTSPFRKLNIFFFQNQQPGAEESFKILGAAFELIGEPEKRRKFDAQRLETQEMEEEMVSQL